MTLSTFSLCTDFIHRVLISLILLLTNDASLEVLLWYSTSTHLLDFFFSYPVSLFLWYSPVCSSIGDSL